MENSTEYSKEALDILGKVPNVIIRYSLLVFLFVLVSATLCLTQIKYPDSIQMPVKMLHSPNIYVSEIAEEYIHTIKIGQKVLISLKEYPKRCYGAWEGTIKNVSVPTDAIFYKVEIELLPSVNSTKGYKLPSELHNIYGTVEYSGKNKSFFQRIFE